MAPVGDAVEVGSTDTIAAGDRGRLVVGEEGMSREDGWREGVACCVVWYGTLQRWQNAALRLLSIVREYGILPSPRSVARVVWWYGRYHTDQTVEVPCRQQARARQGKTEGKSEAGLHR